LGFKGLMPFVWFICIYLSPCC